MNAFDFAGFIFPRPVATLPPVNVSPRQRLRLRADRFHQMVGNRWAAPVPLNAAPRQEIVFYLGDNSPFARWEYSHEVSRSHPKGYQYSQYGRDLIHGLVIRLPHGRGFLAGWTRGNGMDAVVSRQIFTSREDAAYDGLEQARIQAERELDDEFCQDQIDHEEARAHQERGCLDGEDSYPDELVWNP